jgi:tetratricopeptide (TPR) repeat protein
MTPLGRWLLPLTLAFACTGGDGADPLAPCLGARSDEATLELCGAAFETTAAPRAAAAAAWAAQALGRGDEALAWIRRIPADQVPAGLGSLAASLHLAQGEVEEARAAYRADLPLLAAAGDSAGRARAHYGLGFLDWHATSYGPALEHFGAALDAAGTAGDSALGRRALQGLNGVLSAIGDLDAAERVLDRAADLISPADRLGQVEILAQRGSLLLERGLPRLARPALERALELSAPETSGVGETLESRPLRAIHLNLARAALELADAASAKVHLDRAEEFRGDGEVPFSLPYHRALLAASRGQHDEALALLRGALARAPEPDWRWLLEDELGRQLEAVGDRAGARAAYGRAIEVLEAMRRELDLDDLKAWLLERKRHPFEALFRLEAEAGRPLAALGAAERAKARSFLDAFVRTAHGAPGEPVAAASGRLGALRLLLPSLASSPVAALREPAALLAATAGHRVLLYFRAERDLWLLVAAGGRLELRRLGPWAPLERLVDAALAEPDAPRGPGSPWVELADALLPAGSLPASGEPVWIVPDGGLLRLPFAALPLQGPLGDQTLVERHAVAYLPSLNSLAAALERESGAGSARRQVFGDPTGDLPEAAREAREVAARLGVRPLLGRAARRAALTGGPSDVLHLAAHTGFGSEGPWLQLADGRVTAADVLALRIAPRLAVLATCAAAEGASSDLWGSLAAAFLAAGSRSVLASSWSLDDADARRLMGEFYAAGGAVDPAGALAKLQRTAARAGRPPSTWAFLVVFGAALPDFD